MSIFRKVFGGSGADRVDYYDEALGLSQQGQFSEALTSLRLALKDTPGDPVVLQQIAIVYTRMGMDDDAIKTYRHVLKKERAAPGAHYGLAFLLLRQGGEGAEEEAVGHLESFLENRPPDEEAREHIAFAERTLRLLRGEPEPDEPEALHSSEDAR